MYDQEVDLKAGDRLMVDLVDDGSGGIAFRRAIYGDDEEFQGAEKKQGGDWRLTVIGNQKTGDKTAGLALMAAIESTSSTAGPLLQARPGWVGFRLAGEGLKRSIVDHRAAMARADGLPGAGLAVRRAALAGRPSRSRQSRPADLDGMVAGPRSGSRNSRT